MKTPYDVDFVAWTEETAQAIREERWSDIDRDALIDEVESLGKRDRREVISRLTVILLHMLKTQYQPLKYTRSWALSIEEHRLRLQDLLEESPSLRPRAPELLAKAYRSARLRAAGETALEVAAFPEACPWDFSTVAGEPSDEDSRPD